MPTVTEVRESLEQANSPSVVGLSVVLALGVAALDVLTGPLLSISFFYVLPLAILTWRFGARVALATAACAALIWLTIDIWTGTNRSLSIPIWNALIRFGFFMTINGLLTSLHAAVQRESQLARVDPLTGLANRRAFADAATREIARADRTYEPITIAVVDLDDLKRINDTLGHAAGDDALSTVARILASSVRTSDLAARLGGDEFALLLVHQKADATAVLERVRGLVAGSAVGDQRLSCSIGAVTAAGETLDRCLALADEALYEAKRAGKGRVHLYAAQSTSPLPQ